MAQSRYRDDRYRDASQTPVADLHTDLVAVQHELNAQMQQTLLGQAALTRLAERVNRLNGALSLVTQRIELRKQKGG